MHEISLSAIGADRPGIVAALTGVLADLGCSIEDSEMAVLRGNFAVMLVLDAPSGVSTATIESALSVTASELDLVVAARELHAPAGNTATTPGDAPRSTWSIAVYGADRPGIVHGVSAVLAGIGANITELRTHIAGDPQNPLYAMVMEVTLPTLEGGNDDETAGTLRALLEEAARSLGVTVTVQRIDEELL